MRDCSITNEKMEETYKKIGQKWWGINGRIDEQEENIDNRQREHWYHKIGQGIHSEKWF